MRHKCKFEKNVPIDTEGGGQIENYVDILTTFGYLKTSSGSRTSDAGELLVFNSNTLVCRVQAGLVNQIDTSVRVVCLNRIFTIDDWQLVDEKNYYYKFWLKEMKN